MKKTLNLIYLYSIRPITNFIMNIIWWLFHLSKLKISIESLKEYIKQSDCLYSIERIMRNFKWASDPLRGGLDWTPWPVTIIGKSLKDDCDGAASFSCFLCKKAADVEFADVYLIYDGFFHGGHAITIGKKKDSVNWFCFNNGSYFENRSFEAIMNMFKEHKLTAYGKYENLWWNKLL